MPVRHRFIPVLSAALLLISAPLYAALPPCQQMTEEDGPQPLPGCERLADGQLRLNATALAVLSFDADGLAVLMTPTDFHYVTRDGRTAQAMTYDNGADYVKEGLFRSVQNGKVAYLDTQLRPAFSARFDWGWPFENGVATVCNGCRVGEAEGSDAHRPLVGGHWFKIDRTGQPIADGAAPR